MLLNLIHIAILHIGLKDSELSFGLSNEVLNGTGNRINSVYGIEPGWFSSPAKLLTLLARVELHTVLNEDI